MRFSDQSALFTITTMLAPEYIDVRLARCAVDANAAAASRLIVTAAAVDIRAVDDGAIQHHTKAAAAMGWQRDFSRVQAAISALFTGFAKAVMRVKIYALRRHARYTKAVWRPICRKW